VIYRHFIAGTPARAIGVGFPNGTNIAHSAENLAPELFWTGNFMDPASTGRIAARATNSPPVKT
jgi:hypothetical protein